MKKDHWIRNYSVILVMSVSLVVYVTLLFYYPDLFARYAAIPAALLAAATAVAFGRLAGLGSGLLLGLVCLAFPAPGTLPDHQNLLDQVAARITVPAILVIVLLSLIGFAAGSFAHATLKTVTRLESKVSLLKDTNTNLNHRLNKYENEFQSLSSGKVYKQARDGGIGESPNAEQVLGLLLDACQDEAGAPEPAGDRLSQELFRHLVSSRPEILAAMGTDGVILEYHDTLMALLGYTGRQQIIGRNIAEFLMPDKVDQAMRNLAGAIRSELDSSEKYSFKAKELGKSDLLAAPVITFQCCGNPLAIVACLDENTIAAANHILLQLGGGSGLATLIHKPICCIAPDEQIQYINAEAAVLLQATASELAGRKAGSLISHHDYAAFRELIRAGAGGKPQSLDLEVLPARNTRTVFNMLAFPLIGITGRCLGLILFLADITERTRISETLQHRLQLEEMISDISTCFIALPADAMDTTINQVVQRIGDFENAQESYVEIFRSSRISENKTYRASGNKDTITPDASDAQEIVSIPIIIQSERLGYFRFTQLKYRKSWLDADLELIRVIGEIIINALIRQSHEQSIKTSANWLSTTLHSIGDAVIATDTDRQVIMMNRVAENLTGWSLVEAIHQSLDLVFCIQKVKAEQPDADAEESDFPSRLLTGVDDSVLLKARNNLEYFVSISRSFIQDNDSQIYGEVVVFKDITRKKQEDDEIRYISFHDKLTGLYNRTFFEEEITRLNTMRQYPITLILGDCNGLKIANDIFGHLEGDKLLQTVAMILKKATRKEDIVARWGGDEFAIILTKTNEETAASIRERILIMCSEAEMNPIQPSLALGSATAYEKTEDIEDLLRIAEDRMYRHKLLEGKSARNAILQSIEKMIYEKSYETEEHARRMMTISSKVGRAVGLADYELEELSLLSVLHDMGKIGIPDSILLKPEKLTADEWELMKKHPEKGYNIAKSTPELSGIADSILHHHERWDGKGYPHGLEGERIPKLSRILSIVDAYDVITHSRSYKGAQSNEAALDEIERCAGSQFDPGLARVFVNIMQEQKPEK